MARPTEYFKLSGPQHLTAIDWSDTHHRTTIAASLVQGVYVMERDRTQNRQGDQALAPPWWDSFGFQLHKDLKDTPSNSIFGAVYKLKFPIHTLIEVHTPRYVIALRGTVIFEHATGLHDLNLNLKIFLKQNLEKCSRVEQALKSVRKLVDDAGAKNVWLAGHSLGSAIALTVGRNMVKMGFHLETYLFNPPYISVPLEKIKNTTLKSTARMVGSAAKVGVSWIFMDHQQRAQGEETFMQLSGWAPYLCVNGGDPICSEYIGYFGNRHNLERFGALGARMGKAAAKYSSRSIAMCAVGRSAEPFHLLPTANLVINMSVSQNFREAHGVAQWWTESFNCKPKLYKY